MMLLFVLVGVEVMVVSGAVTRRSSKAAAVCVYSCDAAGSVVPLALYPPPPHLFGMHGQRSKENIATKHVSSAHDKPS